MGAKWRSRTERRRELADLASRQHGIVSIRQLTGPLGRSHRSVARAVEDGRLHRLHQGVYAVGHTNLTHRGRCLAAVLASGPGALLSHRSAGWLWGIWRSAPAPYEVTTPIPRRRKPPLIVHYARGLVAADRALEDGIPLTGVPRTLLDLAASVRARQLDRSLERSEELGLFDLAAVEALLARTSGHPGHRRLRRALALYREPSFTRSGVERRFLDLTREAGLPRPSTGFNAKGHELDFYWAKERLAIEIDTFATHGSHAAFERDRDRDGQLRLAGIQVERITDLQLERDPRGVADRVARLLELRREELGAGG